MRYLSLLAVDSLELDFAKTASVSIVLANPEKVSERKKANAPRALGHAGLAG